MSFLIPAAAAALGTYFSGRGRANSANRQNQYTTDQERRDYEAQRALAQEQDQRRLDGVDFLQAVAQGKGYNIPPAAFEALKRRGAYTGMSAQDRIADRPKQGSSVWDALGTGLSTFGGLASQSALNQSSRGYMSPQGPPTWDGGGSGGDLLDYYRSLLPDELNVTGGR